MKLPPAKQTPAALKPLSANALKFRNLLAESAGGIQVSGDPGAGKSTVMELMMQMLIDEPGGSRFGAPGFCCIDPHADLHRSIKRYVSSRPKSRQRDVVIIETADARRISPVNPLAVSRDGLDDITWKARVLKKAAHTARILLHAWGETDFNSKPLLFKYSHWYLETLALAGLPLPEVRALLNPWSQLYQALIRFAPDEFAYREMLELVDLRPKDREEQIASTKNRFLGLLKNPIVDLTLGRIGPTFDARALIQAGAIVLINTEPGGVLRDEDREIISNVWLAEFLFAAYNTPANLRRPFVVFVDELPLFKASAALIQENINQTRKFLLRFVTAHQGTQFFPEGTQDRLLNAVTTACGAHFLFRHQNEIDATFFSKLAHLPGLQPTIEKHVQTTPMQFQDGHDIVVLTDTGANWSEADQAGGSDADATTDTTTTGDGTATSTTATKGTSQDKGPDRLGAVRNCVSESQAEQRSANSTTANAVGTSRTSTASWSKTTSKGGSRTLKQTLVPRIVVKDIVTSVQFFSTEEQFAYGASKIAKQKVGEAVVYLAGKGVFSFRFPLPKNPFRGTPKMAARKLAELQEFVFTRPEYSTPAEINAAREAFLNFLLKRLHALPPAGPISALPPIDDAGDDSGLAEPEIIVPTPSPFSI